MRKPAASSNTVMKKPAASKDRPISSPVVVISRSARPKRPAEAYIMQTAGAVRCVASQNERHSVDFARNVRATAAAIKAGKIKTVVRAKRFFGRHGRRRRLISFGGQRQRRDLVWRSAFGVIVWSSRVAGIVGFKPTTSTLVPLCVLSPVQNTDPITRE